MVPIESLVVDSPDSESLKNMSVSFHLYSTLLITVRGHGVSSMVSRETLLQLRCELRSDAFSARDTDSFGSPTHDSLCANHFIRLKTIKLLT